MKHKIIAILFTSVLFAGCSGNPVKTNFAKIIPPEETHFQNERRTVTIGSEMTSSTPMHRYQLITTKERVQSTTYHRGKERNLVAKSADYALIAEDANGKYYEAITDGFSLNGSSSIGGGLYLPITNDVKPALYWSNRWMRSPRTGEVHMYMSELLSFPSYSKSELVELPPNFLTGLVSTLVYVGMADRQIKFVYREYNDGYARPAFTQEISLDYTPEKKYHYKKAQFIVHNANTNEITLTLISPL
jgi:hypothetical protein